MSDVLGLDRVDIAVSLGPDSEFTTQYLRLEKTGAAAMPVSSISSFTAAGNKTLGRHSDLTAQGNRWYVLMYKMEVNAPTLWQIFPMLL